MLSPLVAPLLGMRDEFGDEAFEQSMTDAEYTGPVGASGRIPSRVLKRVKPEHIREAVATMVGGTSIAPFKDSTDYDLLTEDGRPLPPKAVFGLAASRVIGARILPRHFSGGIGTPCFDAIEAAAYVIVPKGFQVPPTVEDREWLEGAPKLVLHLRRERAWGLARAKKAAFIEQHGELRCEHCGLVPGSVFGEHGDACIEVHHKTTQVADMRDKHATTLADLECLCANCHRIAHSKLRFGGIR